MKRWLFNIAASGSLVLCVGLVVISMRRDAVDWNYRWDSGPGLPRRTVTLGLRNHRLRYHSSTILLTKETI